MSWSETMYIIQNSGVKKVQRGTTSGSGNVTISAVNMEKAFVVSASKGSAGSVAARGTVASHSVSGSISTSDSGTVKLYTLDGDSPNYGYKLVKTTTNLPTIIYYDVNISGSGSVSTTAASASISGGATDLTVKEYSARLTGSTTLYCDGPVEWQVIEYY